MCTHQQRQSGHRGAQCDVALTWDKFHYSWDVLLGLEDLSNTLAVERYNIGSSLLAEDVVSMDGPGPSYDDDGTLGHVILFSRA